MKEKIANEEISPYSPQDGKALIRNQENEVSVVPPYMTNEEIRAAFLTLAWAMTLKNIEIWGLDWTLVRLLIVPGLDTSLIWIL